MYSLSPTYQRAIDEADYEVIVIENGSSIALHNNDLSRFGRNFRYHYIADAPTSPAFAINLGVSMCEGRYIGIMIDGAHLITPGVIQYALKAFRAFEQPVVVTKYFYLGPGQQGRTISDGYTKEVENKLLESIDWRNNGYQLFDISVFIGEYETGWYKPVFESNCLFLKKSLFDLLGGYEERFNYPGGGFANIDFFQRAAGHCGTQIVCLLGEGSFHQLHGGTVTNALPADKKALVKKYRQQYKSIRGSEWKDLRREMDLIGQRPIQPGKYFQNLRSDK